MLDLFIIHSISIWLLIMITHGIFVKVFGQIAEHLPLLIGITVTTIVILFRRFNTPSPGLLLHLIILMIVMAISSIIGMNLEVSVKSIILYTKAFFAALTVACCVRDKYEIKVASLYCLLGMSLGGAFTIYEYMAGKFTINTIYEQRAAGLRGDPNDTAMLMVAGLPLAIYWIFSLKKKSHRFVLIISIVFLLVGIILTGSRGGFVALFLIMLILYMKRPSFKQLGCTLLLVATLIIFAPHSYFERIATLYTGREQHSGESLQKRLILLQAGFQLFLDSPIMGTGPGTFGIAFMNHLPVTVRNNNPEFAVAHNMYLEFFVENGLIGGVLFLLIFIRSLRGFISLDFSSESLNAIPFTFGFSIALALGGMLVAGLFLSQGKNSVLWFMTGLGLAAEKIMLRRQKNY